MTQAEFGTYLVFAAAVCLVLAVVNAFRSRFPLALACLALGATVILYRNGATESLLGISAIVTGTFLVLDVAMRIRRQPKGSSEK